MVIIVVGERPFPVVTTSRGQVCLAADDWFHAGCLGLLKEVHRAKHVAVIGDGDGWHAEALHLLDQWINLIRAVEEAILRVEMKVDELGWHRLVTGWYWAAL